jgi:hypothetical protein
MSSEKKGIKLELAFPYDIQITPTVNGGCIVNVGCVQLSYSTPARMLIDLKKYLADPQGYEKAYNECNKTRGSGNALARPEQPSLMDAHSRRTGEIVEEITEKPSPPEDTGPDQEATAGQQEQAEKTE